MIEDYLTDHVYKEIVTNIEENKKLIETAQRQKKELYSHIIEITKKYAFDQKYKAAIALFLKYHGERLKDCLANCNIRMQIKTQHLPQDLSTQINLFLYVTKNGFNAQINLNRKQKELNDYEDYRLNLEQLENTIKRSLYPSLSIAAQEVIEFVKKQRAEDKSQPGINTSSLIEVLQKTNELLLNYETAKPSFFTSYLRCADKQKGGRQNIVDFIINPIGQKLLSASTAFSLLGAMSIGLSFLYGSNPFYFLHWTVIFFVIAAVMALLFFTVAYFFGVFNARTDLAAKMSDCSNIALKIKETAMKDYNHQAIHTLGEEKTNQCHT